LALADCDFVVGFIGRITEQKNLNVLVDALALAPKVTGVIVGGGSALPTIKRRAKEKNVRNVYFLPAQENAAGLMALFDVFCLPSKWEGLGLVLIEAMLQSVPVIGSNAGAIPEILDDGRAGLLFDPFDANALAAQIEYARTHSNALRSLTAHAHAYAVHHYSIDRMVQDMRRLYTRNGATYL